MIRWFWCLAFVLGLALSAQAQTVAAPCGAGYAVTPGTKCMFIARGLVAASGTSAGPILLNIKAGESFSRMCVAYGNADGACEPGITTVLWSSRSGSAAPAVWSTFGTLTGVASPLVSAVCGSISGPNFRATLDGNSDGTQSAISDAACENSNGVDLVITLYP